jgi:hypothetical protein
MPSLSRLTFAISFVVVGCTTANGGLTATGPSSSDVVAVDRDFELRAGQTARVEGTGLTVAFVNVPEDSRCPVDVQCVWAGNGAVSLVLTDDTGAKTSVILNTTLSPRSVRLAGYEIALTGLKPDPKQGSPIPLANYVASLRVSRAT